MAGNKGVGGLIAFFAIAEIAFAITIIVIVADQLYPGSGYYEVCGYNYSVDPPVYECGTVYSAGICLMTDNSINVCRYAYAVGAIGLIVSVFSVGAMCLPPMAILVLNLLNSIWWLGGAITFTVYNNNVASQTVSVTLKSGVTKEATYGLPGGYWRNIVDALAWTTFALCFVSMILSAAAKKKGAEPAAGAYNYQEGAYKQGPEQGSTPVNAAVV